MTIAQDWARKRNFTKFKLRGITALLSNIIADQVITDHEYRSIQSAQNYLTEVIAEWEEYNNTSKEKYLKKGGD